MWWSSNENLKCVALIVWLCNCNQKKKNKTLKNVLLKKKDKKRAIAAVVFLIFNIYTVFDESKTNMREFLIFNVTNNKLNDDGFLNWSKVKA